METKDSRSRLLSLPSELRNKIYRYILLESNDIDIPITKPQQREPGVLSACQLIRTEAINIYYRENNFSFDVTSMNATRYMEWNTSSKIHRQAQSYFTFFGESVRWTYLLAWLEAWFRKQCQPLVSMRDEDEDPVPRFEVGIRMFQLVARFRSQGLDWEVVKQNLELVRQVAALEDDE